MCQPKDLNFYEMFFIEHFKSFEGGYNLNKGGDFLFNQKITSEQRSEIISKALTGIKKTESHKSSISKSRKDFYKSNQHPRTGVKLTDEQREKISKNHVCVKGKNNPMHGKTQSIETRNKISNANKGKTGLKGSRNGMAILNEEKVKEIKLMIKDGLSNKILSEIYGVKPSTIMAIRHGKIWKHITL